MCWDDVLSPSCPQVRWAQGPLLSWLAHIQMVQVRTVLLYSRSAAGVSGWLIWLQTHKPHSHSSVTHLKFDVTGHELWSSSTKQETAEQDVDAYI